jgi:hypothetical protein
MDKKIISYLIVFVLLISCSENCKELPNSFHSYEQARELVLASNYQIEEVADVSDSAWITSVKYLSCDGLNGFFVIKIGKKTYIHQNMPYELWRKFTEAESKGSFYSRKIRSQYQLKLD